MNLSELKHDQVYVGMKLISASDQPGVVELIEYDGRMGPEDPTIWMRWENGKLSGWWLSGLHSVTVVGR